MEKSAMLTPEMCEKIREMIEQQTIPPDGFCPEPCQGRIVTRVCSLFHGRFETDTPKCEKCGREFLFGDKKRAMVVGREEFERMMRMPLTI